ncbi:hypothetical protein Cgig2_014314 [Carnegiea gigantea]|uniref:Probable purine permease n=1 Tax=Carnegiea gigantea TaxID=171969 RepID=A0A9Q1GRU0_9CARY|nr:hypothetical protein Cgig2_014314 [Carnegiea gigantea]
MIKGKTLGATTTGLELLDPFLSEEYTMEDGHEALTKDHVLRAFTSGDRVEVTNSAPSDSIKSQMYRFKTVVWEAYLGKPASYWILLVLSCGAMLVAFPGSSLLSRLYYANGGKSKWIISWVAVAGWPLTALALFPTYVICKKFPTPLSFKLTVSYAILGFLSAGDNLLYAYAYAYLPASTASLLASSSLLFSALFGYLLVGNKLNASIINAIVIITGSLTIIALDSDSDRMSFHVVLEQQVMVSLFAFIFTTIGLLVGRSFQEMKSEARNFKGGQASYYMVIIWGAITFQLGVLGATTVLFLASTVLAGVLNAVRVPLTSIAAVILLNDPMRGFKILSLILTFWGFCSYIYGNSTTSSRGRISHQTGRSDRFGLD